MRRRSAALCGLATVLVGLASVVTACRRPAPTPTAAAEWPIPADKYVFVERWIEIYGGSSGFAFIDFPTYEFDQNSGELLPHIVPAGHWFPLDDLSGLKVVYGRGTSRTGSAGSGANSRVFAITALPFTEPPKEDADVLVTLERVDADGVVHLRRGSQEIVLSPGQSWNRDGESNVEWGGVRSVIAARERITNYGVQDKSKIQLVR